MLYEGLQDADGEEEGQGKQARSRNDPRKEALRCKHDAQAGLVEGRHVFLQGASALPGVEAPTLLVFRVHAILRVLGGLGSPDSLWLLAIFALQGLFTICPCLVNADIADIRIFCVLVTLPRKGPCKEVFLLLVHDCALGKIRGCVLLGNTDFGIRLRGSVRIWPFSVPVLAQRGKAHCRGPCLLLAVCTLPGKAEGLAALRAARCHNA